MTRRMVLTVSAVVHVCAPLCRRARRLTGQALRTTERARVRVLRRSRRTPRAAHINSGSLTWPRTVVKVSSGANRPLTGWSSVARRSIGPKCRTPAVRPWPGECAELGGAPRGLALVSSNSRWIRPGRTVSGSGQSEHQDSSVVTGCRDTLRASAGRQTFVLRVDRGGCADPVDDPRECWSHGSGRA